MSAPFIEAVSGRFYVRGQPVSDKAVRKILAERKQTARTAVSDRLDLARLHIMQIEAAMRAADDQRAEEAQRNRIINQGRAVA